MDLLKMILRNSIFFILILLVLFSCSKEQSIQFKNTEKEKKDIERKKIREKVHKILIDEQSRNIPDARNTVNAIQMQIDQNSCGTELTPFEYDEISDVYDNVCNAEENPEDITRLIVYPLHIFIISNGANTLSIEKEEAQNALNVLNAKFETAKIKFELKSLDIIKSEEFYNFKQSNEWKLLRNKEFKSINLFITHSILSIKNKSLNGYTTFRRGDDFIILTGSSIKNGITLSHEMGHFFNLYHTHGKENDGTTDELVDRYDCSCTGDDVCDTPSDPNLYGNVVDFNCVYLGGLRDQKGNLYFPDPKNIMSYSRYCREYFTKGQYSRIRVAALKYRNYLLE